MLSQIILFTAYYYILNLLYHSAVNNHQLHCTVHFEISLYYSPLLKYFSTMLHIYCTVLCTQSTVYYVLLLPTYCVHFAIIQHCFISNALFCTPSLQSTMCYHYLHIVYTVLYSNAFHVYFQIPPWCNTISALHCAVPMHKHFRHM